MVVIIDYGMGNLSSVKRKLSRLGTDALISDNPSDITKADKLILPGVGHFRKAVENLKHMNLSEPLHESVLVMKRPILGICLGMQLMARHSEEGDTEGLGWFDADVVKFDSDTLTDPKIPHTGWNQIISSRTRHPDE